MWLKLQHVFCSYLGGKNNKHHAHKTRCLREYLSRILRLFLGNSERQRIGFPFSFKNITLKKHGFLNLSFYKTPTHPVHLWPRPRRVFVSLTHHAPTKVSQMLRARYRTQLQDGKADPALPSWAEGTPHLTDTPCYLPLPSSAFTPFLLPFYFLFLFFGDSCLYSLSFSNTCVNHCF